MATFENVKNGPNSREREDILQMKGFNIVLAASHSTKQ